ncbi:hypothetical protein [Hydrogenophaga sp. BPS33]|uniref:thiolase family protein n=1 Tax=Hydrogenophaga sp. BPS33 TaxID=2651974 RepID=UPI00131FC476|nr:hypothetical protein [Hydrogenophaga sp. BPS33]QHE83950.1 hypothetical protein F9K07_03150 [Hydrogenophaga sp. BPS33]
MQDVFIYDLRRTPVAPEGGALAEVLPSRLVGALLREIAAPMKGKTIDALVLGGDGASETPRHALASAGLVTRDGAWQLQQGGVSSMAALRQAAQSVAAGDLDLAIAGGYHVANAQRPASAFDLLVAIAHPVLPARTAADVAAQRQGLDTQALDAWAACSREALHGAGHADVEVPVRDINGLSVLAEDHSTGTPPSDPDPQNYAATAASHLHADLPAPPRVHHAAHLAAPVDGACLLLLGSADAGAQAGLAPRARVSGHAAVCEGAAAGPAAVATAVRRVLQQAGWRADELDRLEIHDAQAVSAPLASAMLGVPLERINRLGGALVRGDMGAAAGAACLARLLVALEHSHTQRGVAAIADAAGNAIAIALECKATT